MARLPRLFLPDCPQHVIQRGNNRMEIFRAREDYQQLLYWLRQVAQDSGVNIHSYVLMSNHLHLLATPKDEGALGRMMQSLGRRYVQYFNARYARTGTLWEGRYRATLVESTRYFMVCSRYIELNPVRAGLVADPAQYPWSSYQGNVGLSQDLLLTPHQEYWALGNTPFDRHAAYKTIVAQGLGQSEVDLIRRQTNKGWALASPEFVEKTDPLASRRMLQKPKGRPFSKIK